MRSWLIIFSLCASAVLAGCTTTPVVRSEVTTFHEGLPNLQQASYAFEPSAEQKNNLEYRAYQSLIREELERLGLRAAEQATAAQLKVRFNYGIEARDVRVVAPVVVDSAYYYPYYRPYWGSPFGGFGDPFWPHAYVDQRESRYVLYTRRLNITLSQTADKRNLFEVAVVSEGRNGNLAGVMPYLVRGAFAGFPGTSGVPRRIELQTGQEKLYSNENHFSAY